MQIISVYPKNIRVIKHALTQKIEELLNTRLISELLNESHRSCLFQSIIANIIIHQFTLYFSISFSFLLLITNLQFTSNDKQRCSTALLFLFLFIFIFIFVFQYWLRHAEERRRFLFLLLWNLELPLDPSPHFLLKRTQSRQSSVNDSSPNSKSSTRSRRLHHHLYHSRSQP